MRLEVFFHFQVREVSRDTPAELPKTHSHLYTENLFQKFVSMGFVGNQCQSSHWLQFFSRWRSWGCLRRNQASPLDGDQKTTFWRSGYPCREVDLGADKCFFSYLSFSCTDLVGVLRPNQHQVKVGPSGFDLLLISSFSFSLRRQRYLLQ